ncbi:hypothetical protein BV898_02407 [Hypsibius exemplaris]|uniref:F-box domain-containing protein n=1 Tax=Hypsibius exemplaris TaxID=2072580 RepID=A0A1W0X820_HYPEX|nr:hypothetical protein BV898_02407 [Hypsibius exemplaris]
MEPGEDTLNGMSPMGQSPFVALPLPIPSISYSEEIFLRPIVTPSAGKDGSTAPRSLLECTEQAVPETFQRAWELLLEAKNGNIGVLDGFQLVMDTLMWEEGFVKLREEGDQECSENIRRSHYTHRCNCPNLTRDDYSCTVIFSRADMARLPKQIMLQSAVAPAFRVKPHPTCPSLSLMASRYWISNAYSGNLRTNIVEMYRNLPKLAIQLKENVVFKLKAIIAHGLEPPVLVGLDSLPLDVLERIFIRSSLQSAVSLAKTCSRARSVFGLENVWRTMARREFDRFNTVSDEKVREEYGSWRQAFIHNWKTRRTALHTRTLSFQPYTNIYPWINGPGQVVRPVGYMPFPNLNPFDEDNFF